MTGFISKRAMVSDPITGHWIPTFRILTEGYVDNEKWYMIQTQHIYVAKWVRTNNKDLWHEHKAHKYSGSRFDIHEKLYILMILKWS